MPISRGAPICQKYRNHLKILGGRRVTGNSSVPKTTDIKPHRTKFSRHSEVAPRICASLTVSKEIMFVERKERGKKVLLKNEVVYIVYVV